MKIMAALAVLSLAAAGPAWADDWNIPVQPLALQAVMPLALTGQHIVITRERLTATLTILNKDDVEYRRLLAFTAPEFEYRTPSENHPDRSYSDIKVTADGREVALEKSTRAFLKEKDVTEILGRYYMDPNIAGREDEWPTDDEQTKLRLLELIQKGFFDPERTLGGTMWPLWTVRNTYSWAQSFPPGVAGKIAYSYEPLWGSSVQEYIHKSHLGFIKPDLWGFDFAFVMGHFWGEGAPRPNSWRELEPKQHGWWELDPKQYYMMKWLKIPADNISWLENSGSLTIEADFPDENGRQVLVMLGCGPEFDAGLGRAKIIRAASAVADDLTVITFIKQDRDPD